MQYKHSHIRTCLKLILIVNRCSKYKRKEMDPDLIARKRCDCFSSGWNWEQGNTSIFNCHELIVVTCEMPLGKIVQKQLSADVFPFPLKVALRVRWQSKEIPPYLIAFMPSLLFLNVIQYNAWLRSRSNNSRSSHFGPKKQWI